MEKNNVPLVSIVLITYNSSKFVLETLNSVKQQTWNNLELIISDDGSTDNTVELCEDWLEENRSRFFDYQLITVSKNTGIPANCNRGLRAVKGQWVKTISGDDILLSNCISDNIEFSLQFPAASFIVSDMREIDEGGLVITENIKNEGVSFIANKKSPKKQLKAYTRWPVFLNVPTFFCKKMVIEKIGYCDENFKIYEDTTMVIRLLEHGFQMYYLKNITVSYRIHSSSISQNSKVNSRREKESYEIFKKYRVKHLNILNPFDLSVYYECWLRFKYKGIFGVKGDSVLRKLSLFYLYMKLNGVRSY